MEIKVNDYVRIDGYISKIGHLRTSSSGKTYAQWKKPNGLLASGNINIIEKSSPLIIDLIEVGDYVNGEYVTYINKKDNYVDVGYDDAMLRAKDIKSIVTKEMFEQMEYKIN